MSTNPKHSSRKLSGRASTRTTARTRAELAPVGPDDANPDHRHAERPAGRGKRVGEVHEGPEAEGDVLRDRRLAQLDGVAQHHAEQVLDDLPADREDHGDGDDVDDEGDQTRDDPGVVALQPGVGPVLDGHRFTPLPAAAPAAAGRPDGAMGRAA